MASEKLEIDLEALTAQAEKISEHVDDYKSFGKRPFDDDIDDLENMNSDFVAKLKIMVENLNSGNKSIR